jgi:hypothetical protein
LSATVDTAAGSCEVVICLIVGRFRCLSPDYARSTFAEQVDGLTSRHARRTPEVTAVLEAVAPALGGRAGARLSGAVSGGGERTTQPSSQGAAPQHQPEHDHQGNADGRIEHPGP